MNDHLLGNELSDDEMVGYHTCLGRMRGHGPWEKDEYMDTWKKAGRDKVCSFCGSLQVGEFIKIMKRSITDPKILIARSKDNQRAIIRRPGIRSSRQGGVKFTIHHTPTDLGELHTFNQLFNQAIQVSEDRMEQRKSKRAGKVGF